MVLTVAIDKISQREALNLLVVIDRKPGTAFPPQGHVKLIAQKAQRLRKVMVMTLSSFTFGEAAQKAQKPTDQSIDELMPPISPCS